MRIAPLAAIIALAAAPSLAQQTASAIPGAPVKDRVAAGTYAVDAAHTQVTWQVNHLGFSLLQGQLGASTGSLTIDPAKPNAATVDVTFPIDQLSVPSTAFAAHLKSSQLFDVAANPTARFVSTKVIATGIKATITGNLTIKGITKPIILQATLIGAGVHPVTKKARIGFRATASVLRSEFGLGLAVPAVSDNVDLTINAAFKAQ